MDRIKATNKQIKRLKTNWKPYAELSKADQELLLEAQYLDLLVYYAGVSKKWIEPKRKMKALGKPVVYRLKEEAKALKTKFSSYTSFIREANSLNAQVFSATIKVGRKGNRSRFLVEETLEGTFLLIHENVSHEDHPLVHVFTPYFGSKDLKITFENVKFHLDKQIEINIK